jgi:metal-responsive CopG/Arc/MetJ family transcriptional regulator
VKPHKRIISVNLDIGLIEQIGGVISGYKELDRNCTRSELIREAVAMYLEEAETVIAERLSEQNERETEAAYAPLQL